MILKSARIRLLLKKVRRLKKKLIVRYLRQTDFFKCCILLNHNLDSGSLQFF